MTRLELLEAAAAVALKAHCPYSHFRVGAALLTDDGRVFSGANVENASYGLTMCAERVAVGAAVAAGCRHFAALAVVTPDAARPYPCGACRQVLAEFGPPTLPILIAQAGDLEQVETLELAALLPRTFAL